MTEKQARRVATKLVNEQSLSKCSIISSRRITNSDGVPEWIVQLQFEPDNDESVSYAMIVVNDLTGDTILYDSL